MAEKSKINKTEAVRIALESELRRTDDVIPLWERLKALRDRIAAYPDAGVAADKMFFDDLGGGY
ncbi:MULTISPECIES: type II toxin-antitoxin system VapB family antitoxin [unclassified Sinorhizobium]|uniref:type II toxin-antitoxin system VapB family antitoxin n=1 Tax=unclassified Sinorhizobium TaxID=2613772 RepID=UPI0035236D5B